MTANKRDDLKELSRLIKSYPVPNTFALCTMLAEGIVNAGWIPRERAVEHCAFCKECKGRGWRLFNGGQSSCPDCLGVGIVLKEPK